MVDVRLMRCLLMFRGEGNWLMAWQNDADGFVANQ